MAPEILRKQPYKFAADVYSYGVALYHLFTEIEPYSSFDSVFSIAEFVLSGKRLDIPSYVPTQIKDLIQITWSDKPEQRRGFSDIVGYLLLLNDTIEEESYAESSFDVRKEKILDIKKDKEPVFDDRKEKRPVFAETEESDFFHYSDQEVINLQKEYMKQQQIIEQQKKENMKQQQIIKQQKKRKYKTTTTNS